MIGVSMRLKSYLTINLMKHAISVALAIFIAVIANHYAAWSQTGWIILAAFLAGQTSRGTPLRQGVIFSVTMIIAIGISFFLKTAMGNWASILCMMIIFMLSSFIVFIFQPIQNKTLFRIMLLAFVLLIASLSPADSFQSMQAQVIDVTIGAAIGIICTFLILRIRFYKEFQQGVIPVLHAALQYSKLATDFFTRRENDDAKLSENKIAMEESLQIQYAGYPEWVYEVGFNPGLRSGFRFYLLNIERMVEILLSMDYLVKRGVGADLMTKIADDIEAAMQKNAELIEGLIEYFENNKLKAMTADFTSDVSALEKAVKRVIPGHLELLDIDPDYIILSAFVRNIKDLRKLLLQLVMALPANA